MEQVDIYYQFIMAVAGAALSVGVAGIGTIIGTMHIAAGGASLLAEKPKAFGTVLLMAALPSSQGIYGMLVTFLILNKIGYLSGTVLPFSVETGGYFLMAAIPVGLTGLFSGIGQGKVLQSGLRILAKRPGNFIQSVVLAALVESMAVFGLLISILIVNSAVVG
jgi:V/A-type H+-transporting ATPase subunit K